MAGQFRSSVWDPVLILSQIATMQSIYYLGLGLWTVVVDFIAGNNHSLDQFFSYQSLHFKDFHGRLVISAFACTALTGATGLWYVVQRTKQCWDFTVTAHLIHFIACWVYNGSFPRTLSWWLTNLITIIIMTVLGEFMCMRTEMKAIPLSMGPKADV